MAAYLLTYFIFLYFTLIIHLLSYFCLIEPSAPGDHHPSVDIHRIYIDIINCLLYNNSMDSKYFKQELEKEVIHLEARKKDLINDVLSLEQELQTKRQDIDLIINRQTETANQQLKEAVGSVEALNKLTKEHGTVKRLDKRLSTMKEELNTEIQEVQAVLDAHVSLNKSYFLPTEQQKEFYNTQRPSFLEAYTETGNIVAACKLVPGLKPTTVIYYKKKDAQFKEDIDIAYEVFKDKIDAEVTERALNGQMEAVVFQGEVTTEVLKYDNRLLERAAAAHCPEKYDRAKLDRIPDATKPTLNLNIINFNDTSELGNDLQKSIGLVREITEAGAIVKNAPATEDTEEENIIDVEATTTEGN